MGYYDEGENSTRRQKGNRYGWTFAVITGVLLGALVIVFSIPSLIQWNVLPNQNEGELAQEDTMGHEGVQDIKPQQIVNVNVVSQVTEAVDQVAEAVVGVINIQETGFWSEKGQAGTGSGVIYKRENGEAYIITNHHVIEGAAEVEVSLQNGDRMPAEVLGSDIFTDLAVLKMNDTGINKVATLGTSEFLQPGEPVVAIGNPLGLQFSGSVTQGIISGLNRTIEIDLNGDGRPDWQSQVLQTDAAINPGNSGGALVNIEGQVIGINTMKIAREAVEGIGLAIPIDIVKPIVENLEKYGEVRRPYMGIGMRSINELSSHHWEEALKLPDEVHYGAFIVSVTPLSPADQAGLRELDVIVGLDGKKINDVISLRKHLYTNKKIGDKMEVTFYRNGELRTTTMTLTEEMY